ncbi:HyaD/HybD family hydrogenase maturation endopeptidase [Deferribacterales bacterium RsTz2092]|nr:membrane protein [Deferribacterales bacterium]
MKNIVVLGIGNLLLSDEGFGVHAVRELSKYTFPDNVSVYDGGTLGLLSAPLFEGCDLLVLIDAVAADGAAGTIVEYSKDDIMLDKIPVKLSQHQIGFQETLLIAELRGQCPKEIIFLGVISDNMNAGVELSPVCREALDKVVARVEEIIMSAPKSL